MTLSPLHRVALALRRTSTMSKRATRFDMASCFGLDGEYISAESLVIRRGFNVVSTAYGLQLDEATRAKIPRPIPITCGIDGMLALQDHSFVQKFRRAQRRGSFERLNELDHVDEVHELCVRRLGASASQGQPLHDLFTLNLWPALARYAYEEAQTWQQRAHVGATVTYHFTESWRGSPWQFDRSMFEKCAAQCNWDAVLRNGLKS